jgi:hypothetical protein
MSEGTKNAEPVYKHELRTLIAEECAALREQLRAAETRIWNEAIERAAREATELKGKLLGYADEELKRWRDPTPRDIASAIRALKKQETTNG